MRRSVALVLLALAAVAEARTSAQWLSYWNTHGLGFVQSGQQAGKAVKLGSGDAAVDAYLVLPPGVTKPEAAVVIFTDIYGWELNNTRLWADRLAKEGGFLVVVPDFFHNDSLTDLSRQDFGAWLKRHPKEGPLADFKTVVAAIKKDYPSVQKFGQQGFCWGGLYTALLLGPNTPKVDVAVANHASLLTPADIDAITGPVSLQQSDPKLDGQINTTFYDYIDKAFAAKRKKGIDANIKFYPDMNHGYSLRGDSNDPAVAAAANAAFQADLAFLKKYLLPGAANATGAAGSKATASKSTGAPASPKVAPKTASPSPKATPPAPKAASPEGKVSPDTFFNSSAGMHALSKMTGSGATAVRQVPQGTPGVKP